MTSLQLYEKYNYPFPETILISAAINEQMVRFEAMLAAKYLRTVKYASQHDSSPLEVAIQNAEIQDGWDMLEMLNSILFPLIQQLDETHLYGFYTSDKMKPFSVTSPDKAISGAIDTRYNSKRQKALQAQINELKAELNIQ